MKKYKYYLRLLCCLVCLTQVITACAAHAAVPGFAPLPEPSGLRVAIGSDLHLNPDSRPGKDPTQAEFNLELVDALLWDAARQGAKFLLLTGDLVNGGKPHRHAALAQKLKAAEATGLDVCVLPGNHDLDPVTQTEFAEFYAPFGYDEAYSRDEGSLSYAVVRDGLLILMLDTGGYPSAAVDLPGAKPPAEVHAFVSAGTLQWAEDMLRYAQSEGLGVLCAGHYNLLLPSNQDTGSTGFYFENADKLAALLKEYAVPLYLSGHAHTRAYYESGGLHELVTEYLLGYPTAYSVLDLTGDTLTCTPRRIDVDAWARESGQKSAELLHFAQWQQDKLREYSTQNVAYMSERNPLSKTEQREAADFFYFVMDSFWQGSLHEKREAAEAMPGCEAFFRAAEGYAYGWWLRDLLQSAPPELRGFTIGW